MTTHTKRRIALIGLGMAVTPHAKSLLDLAGRAEVVAAVSRSGERRLAFAARFPFPVTADLDAVIADRSIDVAMLLTPPNARVELIERLAASGKHVLMEKPVERTTAAAVGIVETMERAGLRLGIVFQHRFRPAAERLRGLVAGRGLGELAAAHVVLPWWRPQTYYDEPGRGTLARDGGGVLLSQAIHTLDLALSLTGPADEVAAVAGTSRVHRMETEDFVGAGLRFPNGAMGALMTTTAAYPGFPERIELIGTEATAVLAGGDLSVFHKDGHRDRFGEDQGTGGGADPMDFPHDAHRGVLTDFLDALDEDRSPRVSGREALRVHRLIDALLRSSAEGRAVKVEGEAAT